MLPSSHTPPFHPIPAQLLPAVRITDSKFKSREITAPAASVPLSTLHCCATCSRRAPAFRSSTFGQQITKADALRLEHEFVRDDAADVGREVEGDC